MTALAAPLAALALALADGPAVTGQQIVEALETTIADAIARAEPSVVAITRARNPEGKETLAVRGRLPAQPPPDARGFVEVRPPANRVPDIAEADYLPMPGDFGSGVVIGPEDRILTAFHVVQGAARIYVRAPGGVGFDAEVLAADPRSDLAVIAPRLAPAREVPKLPPLALGDTDKLRKGSFLVALGNPYHTARDGRASASWSILANTTRRLVPPVDDRPEVRERLRHQPTLLQLDAKLNLGMSGGAVVNLKGELVGLTTTGGDAEGYDAQAGYAIPLDGLGRRVVEALRAGREVEYGFLGIRLDPTNPNVVGGVEPGTPADEGDLVFGDVILAVNGVPVTPETGLALPLSRAPVGRPVRLRIRRNDEILEKAVFLSKYPVSGEVIATNRPSPWRGLRVDFTSALAASTLDESVLRAMAKGGVGVIAVEPGSSAEAAGLKKGQIITAVDGRFVRSPAEFVDAVRGKPGPVTLQTSDAPVTVQP